MTDANQSTARTLVPAPFVLGRARALLAAASHIDARLLQIAFLASLLVFGALARDFALEWQQVALTFAADLVITW